MTARDYRDLLDLMLDGVVYRKNYAPRRDPDADYIYSELCFKLLRSLTEREQNALREALYTSILAREEPPETFEEALERAR